MNLSPSIQDGVIGMSIKQNSDRAISQQDQIRHNKNMKKSHIKYKDQKINGEDVQIIQLYQSHLDISKQPIIKPNILSAFNPRIRARSFESNPLYSFSLQRKRYLKLFEMPSEEKRISQRSQRTRGATPQQMNEGLTLNLTQSILGIDSSQNPYIYCCRQLKSSISTRRSQSRELSSRRELTRQIILTQRQIGQQSQLLKVPDFHNESILFENEKFKTILNFRKLAAQKNTQFVQRENNRTSTGPNLPFNLNFMLHQIKNKYNKLKAVNKSIQPGHQIQFHNPIQSTMQTNPTKNSYYKIIENENSVQEEVSSNQFTQTIQKSIPHNKNHFLRGRSFSIPIKKSDKKKFNLTAENFSNNNMFKNILQSHKANKYCNDLLLSEII